jgi:hypothetical protein
MTSAVACAHSWIRDARHGKSTNVTLTCQLCGASSVSTGSVRGQAVTVGLDLYPPRGTQVLAPDLYDFFLRQWDAECRALEAAGYTVNRRPPVIRTDGKAAPTPAAAGRGGQDRTRYGVALAVGLAVTLMGGLTMLVAGLTFDLQWLVIAGGATLLALALLGGLVIALS